MKYSLSPEKLRSYVPIFINEPQKLLKTSDAIKEEHGIFEVVETIGVMSILL